MPEDQFDSKVVSLVRPAKEPEVTATEMADKSLLASVGNFSKCIIIGVDVNDNSLKITYGGKSVSRGEAHWMLSLAANALLNQPDTTFE